MPAMTERLQHAWNAFLNKDTTEYYKPLQFFVRQICKASICHVFAKGGRISGPLTNKYRFPHPSCSGMSRIFNI